MTVVCVHSVIDRNKWCGPSGQAGRDRPSRTKSHPALSLNQAGRRVGSALYSSVSLVVTELGGGGGGIFKLGKQIKEKKFFIEKGNFVCLLKRL